MLVKTVGSLTENLGHLLWKHHYFCRKGAPRTFWSSLSWEMKILLGNTDLKKAYDNYVHYGQIHGDPAMIRVKKRYNWHLRKWRNKIHIRLKEKMKLNMEGEFRLPSLPFPLNRVHLSYQVLKKSPKIMSFCKTIVPFVRIDLSFYKLPSIRCKGWIYLYNLVNRLMIMQ